MFKEGLCVCFTLFSFSLLCVLIYIIFVFIVQFLGVAVVWGGVDARL